MLVQDVRWDHSVLMRRCGISRRGEGLPSMISIGLVTDSRGLRIIVSPHTILHTIDIIQFVTTKSKIALGEKREGGKLLRKDSKVETCLN